MTCPRVFAQSLAPCPAKNLHNVKTLTQEDKKMTYIGGILPKDNNPFSASDTI